MENKKTEIAEFYKKVFSDSKLKERLEERVKKITNEEDFKKLIREEIIPLMKKYNVNFSEEDLLNYEKETLKEISNEDLENVSGGASIKSALLAGGTLSMALIGGIGFASTASAMIDPPGQEHGQKGEIGQKTPPQNNSNKSGNNNNQSNGNNVDEGAVSDSSRSEGKAPEIERHEEGGANASASEVRSTEEEPPKISVSEEDAPETNNDTEKAKLKKAFIKELLKHNVNLVSLYDKEPDGSFNDDAIAWEINAVIGVLKENNSVARVNWGKLTVMLPLNALSWPQRLVKRMSPLTK